MPEPPSWQTIAKKMIAVDERNHRIKNTTTTTEKKIGVPAKNILQLDLLPSHLSGRTTWVIGSSKVKTHLTSRVPHLR